jgi:hypothetical protein
MEMPFQMQRIILFGDEENDENDSYFYIRFLK